MGFFETDELQGIDAICGELQVHNMVVVMDWRLEYDLPMRKTGGVWCASRKELRTWRREHPDLQSAPPEIQRIRVKQPRPRRWGL
jgi:hypothetical protein